MTIYPAIFPEKLGLRTDSTQGRGLFAKTAYKPGARVLRCVPHVSVVDRQNLASICSHCLKEGEQDAKLRRCSACKVVWYCSANCQRKDWTDVLHKQECSALQNWGAQARKAGKSQDEAIPDTPIRALGRLILAREAKASAEADTEWWQQITEMCNHRAKMTAEQEQKLCDLLMAIALYVGQPVIQKLDPVTLLNICAGLTCNAFGLTTPTLTNVGVTICPTAALINHSCEPNAVVVFPEGGGKGLQVVAVKEISPGDEILTSYIDISLPYEQRQKELQEVYFFSCKCITCSSQNDEAFVDPRIAFSCVDTKAKKDIESRCEGLVRIPWSLHGKNQLDAVGVCSQCKRQRGVDPYNQGANADWLVKAVKLAIQTLQSKKDYGTASRMRKLLDSVDSLEKIFHVSPAFYPLPALHNQIQEETLYAIALANSAQKSALEADSEKKLLRVALRSAARAYHGQSALFAYGHPVRGVKLAAIARLRVSLVIPSPNIGDDEAATNQAMEQVDQDLGMPSSSRLPICCNKAAGRLTKIEQERFVAVQDAIPLLRNALNEIYVGFYRDGGELGRSIAGELEEYERELQAFKQVTGKA